VWNVLELDGFVLAMHFGTSDGGSVHGFVYGLNNVLCLASQHLWPLLQGPIAVVAGLATMRMLCSR
jgi:hypothetical protein